MAFGPSVLFFFFERQCDVQALCPVFFGGSGHGAYAKNTEIELKSLILAQIERWRDALHMQVGRQHEESLLFLVASGERVSNVSERAQ